nr:Gag-Pol polyprotein [Tanacetum cinerariifolium]
MILESIVNGPLIWPMIEENEQGDDPIDAINHIMSFLSVVVTSRYPTTNNQLRNSSNPMKQATINDGRVTLQPVQRRQVSFAIGTIRTYTPGVLGSELGSELTSLAGSELDIASYRLIEDYFLATCEPELDKFQEDKSMAAFWMLNNQFQKFIDWQYFLDYDSKMTEKLFAEYTGFKVKQFKETLLLQMGNVKKSVAKRTHHKRQYDRRMKERQMQSRESKVVSSKALDTSLVVTECSGTKSDEHITSSSSGTHTHSALFLDTEEKSSFLSKYFPSIILQEIICVSLDGCRLETIIMSWIYKRSKRTQSSDPVDTLHNINFFIALTALADVPSSFTATTKTRSILPPPPPPLQQSIVHRDFNNFRKQRTVICYNYKGEGHISIQCTKPKRKQDDAWFKDKVLLVQPQVNGQILREEELAFLADPGITEVDLMVNLSHYGLDVLAEVYNPDNIDDNMINQSVQAMPSSEQLSVVNHSEIEITSDSKIIPYSQYVHETQQATVYNSNSSTQQDVLILSVIEQLKTQVISCTKINMDNKSVNDTLTTELERYKEQVKVGKEGQNVELKSQDNFSDSHEQNVKIDRLKQTISEQLQEKESLMKTITVLKNDFKKEESSKNIGREIALENKIKHFDNIVFKRDQSAQTVHMLTKLKFFYDHTTKQALGFQNPFYLKKAQQLEPKLYDGNVIMNTYAITIHDSEETLMHPEESHSKMILKQQDPMVLEKKVNTTLVDYAALNQLF